MNLKRILRVKEIQEKERARKIKEINDAISELERERERCETDLRESSRLLEGTSDALRFIFRQKAVVSRIRDIEDKVRKLEAIKELESEALKDIKREEKAVNILREKLDYEEYSKAVKGESLQNGFLHLLKNSARGILGAVAFLMISGIAFSESAVQKKLREDYENRVIGRLSEVEKVIDEKLQKLIEERKKLEALRKRPLSEEEEKEIKKFIKIVSKTPTDEAGTILSNVKPHLAAEILVRLRERKAGQILASMDPQKAAKITEIIMSWRKNAKKR